VNAVAGQHTEEKKKVRTNMETNVQNPIPNAATDPSPTPITPEDLVAQLRAFRDRIPEYGQLTTAERLNKRRAASLKTGFVVASINAVGASGTVQTAVGQTAEDLVQQQSDVVRWAAVEDELRAMLRGVVSANLIRRHRLGVVALQSYSISRNLVRNPEHADLLPHVDEMKRLSKPRRKSDPQQPTPSPLPLEEHPATSQS